MIKPKLHHSWDLAPAEAIRLQVQLAAQVQRDVPLGSLSTVAGIDASYQDGLARAAVAVLSFPDLTIVESVIAERPVSYPYVPGLLSFREAPAVLDAFEHLTVTPDLLVFDGHGIAHPRRLGIASHVGLLVDIPAIGCAKRRLCGKYVEPDRAQGNFAYLRDGDEIIGAVLRTRTGVKPVFISVGHRVNLPEAIQCMLACTRGYRLPEPTRQADKIAGGK
ncbi:MAG: deoxyribonuclease V [Anaerolineae bacterium]|nr:deoxyribonuclease V [Anaerolineae bacterium]